MPSFTLSSCVSPLNHMWNSAILGRRDTSIAIYQAISQKLIAVPNIDDLGYNKCAPNWRVPVQVCNGNWSPNGVG